MRPEQKTKSRTKLYNAIEGTKTITGAAGVSANWTILFNELAAVGDTLQIGSYYFEFVAEGSEDYTKAGSSTDPVLVNIGTATPDATKAAAALVLALHGFAGTAAWGYLHPDDSVGASSSTGTVTINFYPGTFANADTYIPDATFTGTDPTITNVSDGTALPTLSVDHAVNLIDTTGSGTNKEYYNLPDGDFEGQTVVVAIKDNDGSDTPTIIGKLSDTGTSNVEALFTTDEPGMYASFMWIASEWHLQEEGYGTALTFTAAA